MPGPTHTPISASGGGSPPLITVLCGGLGGARLALALQAAGLESRTCFVTNVGDDCESAGLLICPDTDAVLYALSGQFDEERGWGIRGDVFPPPSGGADDWFHVGERDRHVHRMRSDLLAAGLSLSAATARLGESLNVSARVLPATDERLRTYIHTPQGELSWQEWLVRERARPCVTGIEFRGLDAAAATAAVLGAVRDADLLVIAASNPVASIGPILALPGVKDAIRARRAPSVAVSPVVQRRPLLSERDVLRATARGALLAAAGLDHAPVAVAQSYADLVDAYVLDEADAADVGAVERLGLRALVAPTVDLAASARLVATLLELLPANRRRKRGRRSR